MRAEEGREGERREEKRPLSCLLFSFASLSLSPFFRAGYPSFVSLRLLVRK